MNAKKPGSVIKQYIAYLVTGLTSGVIGTLFSKSISFVTGIRQNFPWLLYFLPLAGILTVALYKLLKTSSMGTNQVILSTTGKRVISPQLTPAVFLASALSHLCGASVGREGAALQLGGSSAVLLSKPFKLTESQEKMLIYCGMAGVFSSVFGTPLAAAAFALEVVCVGRLYLKGAIPVCITSFVSYFTAHLLGAHAERFTLTFVPNLEFSVVWKVLLLSVLVIGVGFVFCLSLEFFERIFEKWFHNTFLRIAVGGTVIIVLTVILGTYDYNGAGVQVIENIFNQNQVIPYAFALKILFTCICVGAGYKGGEIVPTLFIGATFGGLVGSLLGLPLPFGAAVCMVALFCCVTNCPLASFFLALELFSGKGIGYIAVAIVICYCFSGKISLYSSQKIHGFKRLF